MRVGLSISSSLQRRSFLSLSRKSVVLLSYLRLSTFASCFCAVPTSLFASAASHHQRFSSSSRQSQSISMSSAADKVAEDIAAYNSCTAAAVTLSNAYVVQQGGSGSMLLQVTRSAQDIENDTNRNYVYTFPIPTRRDQQSQAQAAHFILPPTELSPKIVTQIPSPSGTKVAMIRNDDVKDGNGKTPPRQVLEIWSTPTAAAAGSPSTLLQRIALPTNEKHGKVMNDPATFGRPCWSPDETVIAYAAERKKPETTSFFDPKLNTKDNKKIPGGTNTLGIGKSEQWGEQYYQQEPLVDLFLVNIKTGIVAKVDNVPDSENSASSSLGGYTLSQCIFSPDGESLLYTAWDAGAGGDMPKRLGLIYCQQRPSKIYASSIQQLLKYCADPNNKQEDDKDTNRSINKDRNENCVCLTPKHRLARSPRFSPLDKETGTSKLVFLASEKGFDTHFGHLGLHRMDWKNGSADLSSETVVVKQHWDIRDADTPKAEGEVDSIRFPGLCLLGLPEKCFVSEDTLVTDTSWGSSNKVVRININNEGAVRLINARVENVDGTAPKSQMLLCTTPGGGIVIKETAPNEPGVIAYVPPEKLLRNDRLEEGVSAQAIASLAPLSASTCAAVPPSLKESCGFSYQVLTLERPSDDGNKYSAPIQCILMLPSSKGSSSKPPPMIVLPHGGPHSISSTIFMPEWAFLCGQAGYALLLVNYRGSVGFSQAAVENLPSHVGDLDVKDVVNAVKHLADSGLVDPDRLGVCGGSHGGFLTGHCIGQYPDLFKAACMRNPVTNIASMVTATDIPDWCFIEVCGLGTYDWSKFVGPTKEQIAEMYEKSPIAHSHKVKTPTLVAIGLKDLRVPPSQGIEYYHILRSKGVESKLLMYDDCDHPIGAVCSKADHWINIKHWFDEHMP